MILTILYITLTTYIYSAENIILTKQSKINNLSVSNMTIKLLLFYIIVNTLV